MKMNDLFIFFRNTSKLCLFFLLFVLSATSCTEQEIEPLIEEPMMIRLLADLHVSEAATQHFEVVIRDSFRQVYYEQIFEIHEIDQALFEEELKNLKKNPKKLNTYYDKVIKLLEKDKMQKERGKPEKNEKMNK